LDWSGAARVLGQLDFHGHAPLLAEKRSVEGKVDCVAVEAGAMKHCQRNEALPALMSEFGTFETCPRPLRMRKGDGQEYQMIIKRSVPWHARSTLSRSAHVIARIGLALTGTACGLFVAQVSARIDLVGSVEAMLAMMLYGAAGFYLGIDLPHAPPDHHMHLPPRRGLGTSADMLELLTAAGIFLTAVAAVVSISSIVLGETVEASTAGIICLSWAIGATMQIAAGVIARIKLARAVKTAKLALFFR
jgi:hypothetical protein